MQITDEVFRAFLNCETKSNLITLGDRGSQNEFFEWGRIRMDDFKQRCLLKLCSAITEDECLIGGSSYHSFEHSRYRLFVDCVLQTQGLQSRIHALERITMPIDKKQNPFTPIRFFPNNKITKQDKLLLAFDALILATVSGMVPHVGKIMHGKNHRVIRIELASLLENTKTVVDKITTQQKNPTPPQLILNKHCTECEFQPQCRQIAMEKDDLSLLSGMTERERKRQHNKGIFSVTQLSYTFRARRRPKRLTTKPKKSLALKALTIREHKIYITGNPKLNLLGNPVFLDVEGIPDQNFCYLIGLRAKRNASYIQHSFWANEELDEKEIWESLLKVLAKIDNPQLVHYGRYEKTYLRRMINRYPEVVDDASFLDQIINQSINLLSTIYAHIYFPTYSNGLKEIAQYLGFHWSNSAASGLNALIWRSKSGNIQKILL
jgi:predicted RecB family nuclease